ncbi:MAG: L,D-transpeptidase family protein [Luteolibacter sp.]
MRHCLRKHFFALFATLVACFGAVSCSNISAPKGQDYKNKMVVSVKDQRMLLVSNGVPVKSYKISTSKYGLGDKPGSYRTPLGQMQVAKKIGHRAPLGSVFKSRRRTGEILKPNAKGRDPIVTRILWLKGMESRNRNAYKRLIYIHGTTEESRLGQPVSFGCIRMSSRDVRDLYNRVGWGADVFVIRDSIQEPKADSAVALLNRLTGVSGG